MTFGGASAVLGWLFLQASILIRAKITSIQKDQISSMIKNYCYYFSKITTKFRDEDDEHNWFILSHVTHKNSWIPVLLLVLSRPRSDHSFSWRRFCLLLMHCYLVVVLEKKQLPKSQNLSSVLYDGPHLTNCCYGKAGRNIVLTGGGPT